MKADLVMDFIWGSAGKGGVAGHMALRRPYDAVVCAYGTQAGHTYNNAAAGIRMMVQQLPVGIISPTVKRVFIGPGALIHADVLRSELEKYGHHLEGKRLMIHEHAAVVEDRHSKEEYAAGYTKIGSTAKGVGRAAIERIERNPENPNCARRRWAGTDLEQYIVDRFEYDREMSRVDYLLIEGAQGFSLSVYHGDYPYCLSYESRVLMADGTTRKIGELVDKKSTAAVLCRTRAGTIEPRPVTNWVAHDNPSGAFKVIVTEDSTWSEHDDTYIGARFTPDHRVTTTEGVKRVDELVSGDLLYTTEKVPHGAALQVLLGSLLGDGTIPQPGEDSWGVCLQISHGAKQVGYLDDKAAVLSRVFGGGVRDMEAGADSFAPGNLFARYSTNKSRWLKRAAEKYGCLGPKTGIDVAAVFADLDWLGLAIWFQDDGQYKLASNGPEVVFHTQRYPKEAQELMVAGLRNKFGIVASINSISNNGKRYNILRLSRHSHAVFFEGIRNYIHPDLDYKVEGESEWNLPDDGEYQAATTSVVAVVDVDGRARRGRTGGKYSYCIEVEGEHNFFVTNGHGRAINVENCTSRDVTPWQIAADCALPWAMTANIAVYGVVRTYPIRVNNRDGSSGPAYEGQRELDWEEIGQKPELTTVTKLPRRVFEFSMRQLEHAVWHCADGHQSAVVLSFADYCQTFDELVAIINQIERVQPLDGLVFGPDDADVLWTAGMPWGTKMHAIRHRWEQVTGRSSRAAE